MRAPPAVGEEVDDRDDERNQQRDEQQLDRPAAHDAAAGPDVARRALRQLEALVERADQLLRRAPELRRAGRVESRRAVGERRRRTVAGGRQRHRRNTARDERPLLVEREREAEVDELAEEARCAPAVVPVCSSTRCAAVSTRAAAASAACRR